MVSDKPACTNQNKTFVTNFSFSKTLTHTLNIVFDNQYITYRIDKILGYVFRSQLIMETPHRKIIQETTHSMLYDRKRYYCLTLDSLKTVYFTHFQSLLQFGMIFWGSAINLHKALIKQKRVIRVMVRLGQRTSCAPKFKKLLILTVPC